MNVQNYEADATLMPEGSSNGLATTARAKHRSIRAKQKEVQEWPE